MTEQEAAVARINCVKCNAFAGNACVDFPTEVRPGGTVLRTVRLDLPIPPRDQPHPIRMVHYRRYTDPVTRLGDLSDDAEVHLETWNDLLDRHGLSADDEL